MAGLLDEAQEGRSCDGTPGHVGGKPWRVENQEGSGSQWMIQFETVSDGFRVRSKALKAGGHVFGASANDRRAASAERSERLRSEGNALKEKSHERIQHETRLEG